MSRRTVTSLSPSSTEASAEARQALWENRYSDALAALAVAGVSPLPGAEKT